MRSLLDTEEEEDVDRSSEVTLSTASLLGIFFGLVLVCGVFFGFGYSMGRGTGARTQASRSVIPSAGAVTEPDDAAIAESTPTPASPVQAEQKIDVPVPAKTTPPPAVASSRQDDDAASVAPKDETPRREATAPLKKPSAALPAVEQPATVAANMTAIAGSGQPMVQIAAVARREDADVLVSALRQRGYGVVVRNEPQDKLLHVQVGPFADRTQATAIKQKLLSDGYNAIIKQ
jgi:DedD protein